jgi:hypothetical protein
MSPIVAAGVLIGVGCGAWTFVMGFTGWYRDPALAQLLFIPVVMAIEIAGLVWGLRRTAAQGRTYGGQILAGTMMSVVASVVIVACSLLFTLVVFPEPPATTDPAATPAAQAVSGLIGTLATGIVASAIIGLFFRSRPDRIQSRSHPSL